MARFLSPFTLLPFVNFFFWPTSFPGSFSSTLVSSPVVTNIRVEESKSNWVGRLTWEMLSIVQCRCSDGRKPWKNIWANIQTGDRIRCYGAITAKQTRQFVYQFDCFSLSEKQFGMERFNSVRRQPKKNNELRKFRKKQSLFKIFEKRLDSEWKVRIT